MYAENSKMVIVHIETTNERYGQVLASFPEGTFMSLVKEKPSSSISKLFA